MQKTNQSFSLDYDPIIFLRCHSKTDRDTADVRTPIWQLSFEPRPNSNLVATCGGDKVCIININTSNVEQRYTVTNGKCLFALSWSFMLLDKCESSILIAGGEQGTLYFISPELKCQVAHFSFSKNTKQSDIYSLSLHPEKTDTFFCAMSGGDINLLHAKLSHSSFSEFNLITSFSCNTEIVRTAICEYSSTLFVATDKGLYGWSIVNDDYEEWKNKMITFNLQMDSNNHTPESKIVDSVEILDNGFVACKYALHAFIYIWHVEYSILNGNANSRIIDILPLYKLIWCLSDNYYMEMSVHWDFGLLTCGDNKGSVWFYDISCLKNYKLQANMKVIDAIKVIMWPEVEDEYHTKSKKLNLDTDDIVIGKAVLSQNGNHLVAITNRNAVCLWSRRSS